MNGYLKTLDTLNLIFWGSPLATRGVGLSLQVLPTQYLPTAGFTLYPLPKYIATI